MGDLKRLRKFLYWIFKGNTAVVPENSLVG